MATLKKAAAPKKAAPRKPVQQAPAPAPRAPRKPKEPEVTIIDFAPETKELLREFIKALSSIPAPVVNVAPAPMQTVMPAAPTATSQMTAPVQQPAPTPAPVQQAAPAATTPAPAPVQQAAPTETAAAVDLTALRTTINVKAEQGKIAQIVQLLGKFGAQSASTLDPSNYTAFYNELTQL